MSEYLISQRDMCAVRAIVVKRNPSGNIEVFLVTDALDIVALLANYKLQSNLWYVKLG